MKLKPDSKLQKYGSKLNSDINKILMVNRPTGVDNKLTENINRLNSDGINKIRHLNSDLSSKFIEL